MTRPGLVVLGTRNLGAAILRHFVARGWRAAGIARSAESLDVARAAGAVAVCGDAREPASLREALGRAVDALDSVALIVNAVGAPPAEAGEPFGGGSVADAALDQYRRWGAAVGEAAFVFLSEGARLLREGGDGGTLVQLTGETGRRVPPGQGLWASGHMAARALVLAAAQELRGEGIRACLLVVDAPVDSPRTLTEPGQTGLPADATVAQENVARAIEYLTSQGRRGLSYELQLTAAERDWVP